MPAGRPDDPDGEVFQCAQSRDAGRQNKAMPVKAKDFNEVRRLSRFARLQQHAQPMDAVRQDKAMRGKVNDFNEGSFGPGNESSLGQHSRTKLTGITAAISMALSADPPVPSLRFPRRTAP
jgi:hypothetical protein